MAHKLYPVILCGGSGTRLWPMSRKSYPKQFVSMFGKESLLQSTVRRFAGAGFEPPLMLSNNAFRFLVGDQLAQLDAGPSKIVIEPSMRNTAPAIAAAAVILAKQDPDALILVAPSDHVIEDEAAFQTAVNVAADAAAKGAFVTFGIRPTRPETGFGYIELDAAPDGNVPTALPFEKFVEKPDEKAAEKMVASGRYLWNSGMFMFSANAVLAAFEKHAPAVLDVVKLAVKNGAEDLDFFRMSPDYDRADNISFDYAIMENVSGVTVPLDSGWNDLGSWKTVWQEADKDDDGVALGDTATAIDCENTLLQSRGDQVQIVGIGLKNIVAIAMRDAVLVADMDQVQSVKQAVEHLKSINAPQAEEFPKCHRPWGWYETLALGDRFQVKNIMVKPGAQLSLQSHVHRSEHWVVVAGTANVTVDDRVDLLTENQSVYIPLGAVHRLENPGKVDLHLIEVQTGSYLGEDDIIRYEDIYARV
ncbi:mannose-1-phosphate guanylyltransferase/mannose-6-phosphate isomerase [Amylibacter ulvae]|uniref:mannose-1-phosphate guanylyltransferase n=1 Tax=Paramylibacter ulvae TaxID=1651968 RepID=A0ABQ3CYQ0_9RHOB|nr:mannose-1-phosphate guanylyltransferase/mannose-6-phosphate isomerase [Amylibacter ulvae]GHA48634.1 mannose-1-phosphate guanylyltransferase/mannose-6-phosphate isomerase [Amylibacter ulvae]